MNNKRYQTYINVLDVDLQKHLSIPVLLFNITFLRAIHKECFKSDFLVNMKFPLYILEILKASESALYFININIKIKLAKTSFLRRDLCPAVDCKRLMTSW